MIFYRHIFSFHVHKNNEKKNNLVYFVSFARAKIKTKKNDKDSKKQRKNQVQ